MKTSKLLASLVIVAAAGTFSVVYSKDAPKADQTTAPAPSSDDTITAQVQAALSANPQTAKLKLTVSTKDGVVHIVGDAPGGGEKDKVFELAKAVDGVKSVINDITVHDH